MTTKDARDAALARLASEPPPSFVATRKALASELRSSGDAPGAKTVLARRRPTWTSWALGRAARADATALREVIAARAALSAAVKAGDKIASAQAAFSRALEATGKTARAEMEAAGHAGAAGEARKLRAALRLIAEQGESALARVAAGDFVEATEDAADRAGDEDGGGTGGRDDDGGFLAAAKASLAAKQPAAEAAARARAKADAEAKSREKARLDKERRAIEIAIVRAEKTAARAADRVEAIETELTDAIAAREEADAHVKELRARFAARR